MKVTVLLADKGTPNPGAGTLNLLNVGWSRTTLDAQPAVPGGLLTPPHAVAIFFEVEPRHCNHPIQLVVELVTEDGNPVSVLGPAGPQSMRILQEVTVQSPGGMPTGSPGVGNVLLEMAPGLPLQPGGYEWRVTLAGEHQAEWSARFHVAAPMHPMAAGFVPFPPPEDPGT